MRSVDLHLKISKSQKTTIENSPQKPIQTKKKEKSALINGEQLKNQLFYKNEQDETFSIFLTCAIITSKQKAMYIQAIHNTSRRHHHHRYCWQRKKSRAKRTK